MSDMQAALAAGYSKATATQAAHSIENPRVLTYMARLMDNAGITDEKLVAKIDEGLEAMRIQGTDDNFIEVADHNARHKYLDTALKLKQHYPKEEGATNTTNILVIPQELITKYAIAPNATKGSNGQSSI